MSSGRCAVITAAGVGSRLGMNMPKCLVAVHGRSIIDYQLDLLRNFEEVRIVVGFQRDRVIEHVLRLRSDVVFVCNHRYASTTVLESVFLGIRGLTSPFLVLDGDVIPERKSFEHFLACCEFYMPLTSYCAANSTDPVYADIDLGSGVAPARLTALTRTPPTAWEWPGISYLDPSMIEDRNTFVYQQVERWLPMAAIEVKCWEIDTPDDMRRAEQNLRHD